MKKDPIILSKMYTVNHAPSLPQAELCLLSGYLIRKNEILSPLVPLDTGSELILIPGISKCYCGLPVRVEIYGGQVTNEFYLSTTSQWAHWVSEFIFCLFPQFWNN